MSFTAFTAVTGYPLQGIDLYLQSSTGEVLNTRSNLEVRHNETNRFFAIPYNAALTSSDLYIFNDGCNFMSIATSRIVATMLFTFLRLLGLSTNPLFSQALKTL